MTTEILQKTRTTITAQGDGTALTAEKDPNDAGYTGDSPATLDNQVAAAAGQPKGAYALDLELDVTTGPSTAAVAKIYYRTSRNNSDWTRWRYSHTVGEAILTDAELYRAGLFYLSANYTQLAVMADNYAFAAKLYATPIIPGESQ